MMESELETIRAALAKHVPHRVMVYQGDQLAREVPVPGTKKRWAAVLDVIARLSWTRLELVERGGGLLCVLDAPGGPPGDEAAPSHAMVGGREEALLRLLLAAQKEALSYRDRESAAALQACVAVMREMTSAVSALSSIHRLQMEAQASAFTAAASVDGPEDLASSDMLKQLAPIIMARLLAPTPPAAPSNGSSGGKQ